MSLSVTKAVEALVRSAAEAAFPEECCGFLLGPTPEDFEVLGRPVVVEAVRPLPNGWESGERTRRYQIDPKLLAKVEEELSGSGRSIVGFYHSHPGVPAWPSPFDLLRAWPCYSYWIVSVMEGKTAGSRSWMRSEDGESFIEEAVEVA
ncbi:MAG: M67 family metallopeptidase [Elusimicrobiota bacterium]